MREGRSLARPYVTRGDLKLIFLIRSDPVLLCNLSLFRRYTVITTDAKNTKAYELITWPHEAVGSCDISKSCLVRG